MNFKTAFKRGQEGEEKGIPILPGLSNLNKALNGVHKGRMYTIAAASKVGKSTLVDYIFLLSIYEYWKKLPEKTKDIFRIYYLSYEINRIAKEFDMLCYYLGKEGITSFKLPEGRTYQGKSTVIIDPDLIRGRKSDDGDKNGKNEKLIKLPPDIIKAVKRIYSQEVEPLFGEWDEKGNLITPGFINFIEEPDNPTGLYKFFLKEACKNNEGSIITRKMGSSDRIVGYNNKRPEIFRIVIIDHVRRLVTESGNDEKKNIDKLSFYQVQLRNWCSYTFINIIHTNRELASTDKMRALGEWIHPTSENIKGTGNLSEDSDYVITMFNPLDDRYALSNHMGIRIKDSHKNPIYPGLRSIHIVDSRHCIFPQHFHVTMLGNIKTFRKLRLKQ